jgi:hypothetical protein
MLFAVLLACSPNRVVGTVAGAPVPVESAYLAVEPEFFGDDDLVRIRLASIPNACDADRFYEEQVAAATTPDELAEAWSNAYPPDFWSIDLVAWVPGGSWPPKDRAWQGLAWDALPERSNTVFATFNHYVAWLDAAWFTGEVADEDDYDHVFYSDLGLARWGGGTPAQRLSGRMSTNVRDGAGDLVGRVELRFDATPCPIVGTAAR